MNRLSRAFFPGDMGRTSMSVGYSVGFGTSNGSSSFSFPEKSFYRFQGTGLRFSQPGLFVGRSVSAIPTTRFLASNLAETMRNKVKLFSKLHNTIIDPFCHFVKV